MKITDSELERLGELVNIDLDPDSRESLKTELSAILKFVEKVQNAITGEGEDGTGRPGSAESMREDVPETCLDRGVVFGQAPDSHSGHFRVPPVIDGDKA